MRWFYILVLTIALTHTVSVQADDPTQAQAAVDAEKKNVDNSNKKFAEKLEEVKKAEETLEKDPNGSKDGKTNKEILEEKKKELAQAALDKVNADSALKTAQDRMAKLKGDADEHGGHQSQEGSQQSAGKSEGNSAKDKAMAEAMKQAAAQKQQEDQKKEDKKEEQPKQEPTQTAEKEKPAQDNNSNQEEQVATIPEDIKKSLEAPYAKDEQSNSSSNSESQSKKASSSGYDDIIKANNELAAAKAKETSDTLASLNAEKEAAPASEAASDAEKTAKPITVNEYIDGVVAQNSTNTRSPASTVNRTTTSGTAAPRAMKGTSSSSRLLNSIK